MFDRLSSLLFPNRCLVCDEPMGHRKDGFYLCEDCGARLAKLQASHRCKLCGRMVAKQEDFCSLCLTHCHDFDRALSCFTYADEAKEAIRNYKFNQYIDSYRCLSQLLYRLVLPLHREEPFDLILFPPMTKASFNQRGYNQSELLAEALAKKLGVPCLKNAFIKVKETPPQSSLGYSARMKNLKGAFALAEAKSSFDRKRILLVDDVLTTGATADALSKLLKNAKEIIVATIAATSQMEFTQCDEIDISEIVF